MQITLTHTTTSQQYPLEPSTHPPAAHLQAHDVLRGIGLAHVASKVGCHPEQVALEILLVPGAATPPHPPAQQPRAASVAQRRGIRIPLLSHRSPHVLQQAGKGRQRAGSIRGPLLGSYRTQDLRS